VDIHEIVDDDPIVAAIHRHAEVFDPKAEFAFSWLQVRLGARESGEWALAAAAVAPLTLP
jgi:hypothetical protein